MSKIRKFQVTEGLYWVEVPEADLFIQCGSPADSVKHLMKMGLITSAIKDGISIETGPNVILLADVSLQNSHVTNLAEFPVLQMLYRQGMILPGHPNNTGLKPLLIGSEEQIQSQMQYIYRGNYGLISEEEIISTGVSTKTAYEMMRIKLNFAFGQIRSTEALLDSKIIGKKIIWTFW
jgi:hemerythrin